MALHLNLTDQEASSKAREYTVLPTGSYACNIVEIKEEVVRPGSDNTGKPYWNVQFTVDEPGSEYDGRYIYSNLMMFEGAAFLIKQLVEVLFPDMLDGNQLSIPEADAFQAKKVRVVGTKYSAGSSIKKRGKIVGKRENDAFEVKGFKSIEDAPSRKSSAGNSLLP